MQLFKAPKESVGDLDAEAAATVIATAADVALVVDGEGVIRDLAFPKSELSSEFENSAFWIGRPWSDLLSEDSKPKARALIQEASTSTGSRWRQLNHLSDRGHSIPVLYSVVRLRSNGRFIAVGRDLQTMEALQQRLIDAQMTMERDYSRLRHAETRYRVLFQTSPDPILIVEATTDRVVDANPSAVRHFGASVGKTIGSSFPAGLDGESIRTLQSVATGIRAGRNVEDTTIRLASTGQTFVVSLSMFRQGAAAFYLMRFAPERGGSALPAPAKTQISLLKFIGNSLDGYVVTGPDGRIVVANAAFQQMAQIMTEDQARGQPIDRWLGRTEVDSRVLLANLKQHGSASLFATVLRGDHGAVTEVEVSAVAVKDDDESRYGFAIRNVGRRLPNPSTTHRELTRSPEQLKDLIGRVPLKDIVRETTDVIERLCIEAALELTNDNRASAAEMLGLSRQSLYVKLRRFGLADSESGDDDDS
ncbi:MAG: transcriptional regulator PpsR [Pseudorhodoplanes sp.]|nr:transcriptional regulator PpsR [Pseudorhodoplanes sp.]